LGASGFFELGKEFLRRLNRSGKDFGEEKGVEERLVKWSRGEVLFVGSNEERKVGEGKKSKTRKEGVGEKGGFEEEERREIENNSDDKGEFFGGLW